MTLRPLPPGPVENDDDGNPLPQPEPASDLADVIQLMEWARMKGYRVGPMVRVGKIALQIRDVRQREGIATPDDKPEPSIWAEHGLDPEV